MSKVTIIPHPPGLVAIENRIENLGSAITKAVADDAEDAAPIKTGELVSSIVTSRGAGYVWYVSVSAEHWSYQEYGTIGRNPVIRPVHKRALWWPGLTHPVAIVTRHPGNAAQPFMRPAVYQTRAFWFTPTGGVAVSR